MNRHSRDVQGPFMRAGQLDCMTTRHRHAATIAAALVALAATATGAPAQQAGRPWTFRTSALITGNSDTSLEGYKAMSGFGLGIGVRRRITGILSAELDLATISREVVIEEPPGGESSQGSVESIPMNLLVQVRPALAGGRPSLRRPGAQLHAGVGEDRGPGLV
jgi:hypothetical protein